MRVGLAGLVLAAGWVICGAAAVGQGDPSSGQGAGQAGALPAPAIRATARLVVLDVVVTDAKGMAVHGLKREDFHVTEMGEAQTVQNFDTSEAHHVKHDAVINSTADLDRLAPGAPVNIILLDEFNTRFEDMAFARYSLKQYLKTQPDKLATPTMLLAVSLQKFEVLNDYTQDKQAILNKLDHHFAAAPWAVHDFGWTRERLATAFGTLERVAEATIGHQGHKNMIWIGRGFPTIDRMKGTVDSDELVNNSVQTCVNMLRDARVTLYAVDPAGLMIDPGKYGEAARRDDPFGGNYQFTALAKATGGTAMYGYNDVDMQIAASAEAGSNFYTLTYRPTTGSGDPKKFRKIAVTVDQPGVKITTREGYYLPRGPGSVNPVSPSKRLKFDLLSAEQSQMVYDGVPVTVARSEANKDEFFVKVDGKGLVWTAATDTEPRHTDIVLMATTFDKKGKELKRIAKEIQSGAPAGAAATGPIDVGLKLPVTLAHDDKAVRVRFVVRVSKTGREGTADFDLVK